MKELCPFKAGDRVIISDNSGWEYRWIDNTGTVLWICEYPSLFLDPPAFAMEVKLDIPAKFTSYDGEIIDIPILRGYSSEFEKLTET